MSSVGPLESKKLKCLASNYYEKVCFTTDEQLQTNLPNSQVKLGNEWLYCFVFHDYSWQDPKKLRKSPMAQEYLRIKGL